MQKLLERQQLVRDALDEVHPVGAEKDLLAVEPPLQIDDLILHRRLLKARLEAVWIDADGEGVNSDGAPRGVVKYAIGSLSHALGAGHPEHSSRAGVAVRCAPRERGEPGDDDGLPGPQRVEGVGP